MPTDDWRGAAVSGVATCHLLPSPRSGLHDDRWEGAPWHLGKRGGAGAIPAIKQLYILKQSLDHTSTSQVYLEGGQ